MAEVNAQNEQEKSLQRETAEKRQEEALALKGEQKKAEATGLDKLKVDIESTGEKVTGGVKEAADNAVNEVDKDVSGAVKTAGKEVSDTIDKAKDEVKNDLGVGTTGNNKASRFDEAASGKMTENIKEPEKDEEIYMSRKMQRYQ